MKHPLLCLGPSVQKCWDKRVIASQGDRAAKPSKQIMNDNNEATEVVADKVNRQHRCDVPLSTNFTDSFNLIADNKQSVAGVLLQKYDKNDDGQTA